MPKKINIIPCQNLWRLNEVQIPPELIQQALEAQSQAKIQADEHAKAHLNQRYLWSCTCCVGFWSLQHSASNFTLAKPSCCENAQIKPNRSYTSTSAHPKADETTLPTSTAVSAQPRTGR